MAHDGTGGWRRLINAIDRASLPRRSREKQKVWFLLFSATADVGSWRGSSLSHVIFQGSTRDSLSRMSRVDQKARLLLDAGKIPKRIFPRRVPAI